jgi:hypothetical protein
MTGNLDVEMLTIFADQSPTNNAATGQRGRAVDSLNCSVGTGTVVVDDEVSFVGSDGEGASGIKNDVDDVGARTASRGELRRSQGRNRIE